MAVTAVVRLMLFTWVGLLVSDEILAGITIGVVLHVETAGSGRILVFTLVILVIVPKLLSHELSIDQQAMGRRTFSIGAHRRNNFHLSERSRIQFTAFKALIQSFLQARITIT